MLNVEKIKYYYVNGYWTEEMVRNAVDKNKITEEECNQILSINK